MTRVILPIHVVTRGTVQTWRRIARIHPILAVGSAVFRFADAGIVVDAIDAAAAVHAAGRRTILVVDLTVDAAET